MRVAIIGPTASKRSVDSLLPPGITEVVTADLPGICRKASQWADKRHIPKLVVSKKQFSHEAGKAFMVFRTVVSEVDLVLLFDDGLSEDVKCCRLYATLMGKPVNTIRL